MNKKNIALLILAVALITVAFFYSSPAVLAIRNFLFKPAFPVLSAFFRVQEQFADWTVFFTSRTTLLHENNKLRQDNEFLASRVASLIVEEAENTELKKIIKIKEESPLFDFLPSRLIGFIRDGRDEYALIASGKRDGVHSDLLVLDSEKAYIGRIAESYDYFSKVKLVTSASEAVDAVLLPSRTRVLVRGNGMRELLVDLVPRNVEVRENDQIVLAESPNNVGFTPILAKVVDISESENQIFKSVKAFHYFDPAGFSSVLILKNRESL